MERQRCKDCRWFLRYTGQDIGQCRRYPPTENTEAGWLEVDVCNWCGEWADKNITREQHDRRELVRRFAVAITEGWYASANRLPENQFVWPEEEPWRVWEQAEVIVEWEGRKEGDSPKGQT